MLDISKGLELRLERSAVDKCSLAMAARTERSIPFANGELLVLSTRSRDFQCAPLSP